MSYASVSERSGGSMTCNSVKFQPPLPIINTNRVKNSPLENGLPTRFSKDENSFHP